MGSSKEVGVLINNSKGWVAPLNRTLFEVVQTNFLRGYELSKPLLDANVEAEPLSILWLSPACVDTSRWLDVGATDLLFPLCLASHIF